MHRVVCASAWCRVMLESSRGRVSSEVRLDVSGDPAPECLLVRVQQSLVRVQQGATVSRAGAPVFSYGCNRSGKGVTHSFRATGPDVTRRTLITH